MTASSHARPTRVGRKTARLRWWWRRAVPWWILGRGRGRRVGEDDLATTRPARLGAPSGCTARRRVARWGITEHRAPERAASAPGGPYSSRRAAPGVPPPAERHTTSKTPIRPASRNGVAGSGGLCIAATGAGTGTGGPRIEATRPRWRPAPGRFPVQTVSLRLNADRREHGGGTVARVQDTTVPPLMERTPPAQTTHPGGMASDRGVRPIRGDGAPTGHRRERLPHPSLGCGPVPADLMASHRMTGSGPRARRHLDGGRFDRASTTR
jgi:hypothetical protein